MINRISVFAHYDKDNVIDDYVIRYVKELRKISKVIFVSDCNLPESELAKINDIVAISKAGRHGEYDFGSYKRGFQILCEKGWDQEIEELIFANDSCYAISSFEDVFCEMKQRQKADFWGMTRSTFGFPVHVQSYFMVFSSSVFNHAAFSEFMNAVEKQPTKSDIITKYELGLTQLFVNLGFSHDSYVKEIARVNNMLTKFYFDDVTMRKIPLLKVDMLRTNPCFIDNLLSRIKNLKLSKEVYDDIIKHVKTLSVHYNQLFVRKDITFLSRKIFHIKRKDLNTRVCFLGIRIYKLKNTQDVIDTL